MGRPLNSKYFGEPTGDNNKLTIEFWDGSSVVTGWILEQVATGEFRVTDGTVEDRVELQADAPAAAGEGRIAVQVYGGGTEYARNILSRRVKTFEGGNWDWELTPANKVGMADLPLA